jgi:hypothetical protein
LVAEFGSAWAFRISGFGFLSTFGPRISAFGHLGGFDLLAVQAVLPGGTAAGASTIPHFPHNLPAGFLQYQTMTQPSFDTAYENFLDGNRYAERIQFVPERKSSCR